MQFKRKNSSSKSRCHLDDATLNKMISERAYYIWESKGRPEGADADNWAQAEREVRARLRR